VRLVLAESSRVLGHHPSLIQHGVLALVPDSLASEAVDVIRELLTNVAKHARATHSSVNISVEDNWLTVTVADNGVGPDQDVTPAGLGLGNLSQRATGHGGRFSFDAGEIVGSAAVWAVPLS